MQKKAIIVGSGIAGLASAVRLAIKGYDVQVFEANSYLGGKLTQIQLGEYRFDAGPSLFTMPQFVEELFEQANEPIQDYFEYDKNDVCCNYFFEDGTFFEFHANEESLAKEIEEKLGVSSAPTLAHLKRSKYIYEKTKTTFLEQTLHKFSSFVSLDILKTVAAIPWLGIFTTMHAANEQKLNHPKLVQLFDRYATYNGSDPYQAPGILNIIPHLEYGIGTYFPKKGMHSIPLSIIALGKKLGVKYYTDSRVEEIVVENKVVKGISVNGEKYMADIVVCNSDVKPAYKHLLKETKAPKKSLTQEPSSSAMIFYWGIEHKFPELDLHNIFFTEDYKKEFDTMFQQDSVCDDPTVYIHVSSKKVENDAPANGENWFVMVNVPHNSGQDWETLRTTIRKNVLTKLSRLLKTEIEPLIKEEDYLDPLRIEERTSSFGGALYGASSNDRMAAFFRHPNFSKVNGLYFVGGSVHPGGGIPLCLLSAKIAADLINKA